MGLRRVLAGVARRTTITVFGLIVITGGHSPLCLIVATVVLVLAVLACVAGLSRKKCRRDAAYAVLKLVLESRHLPDRPEP